MSRDSVVPSSQSAAYSPESGVHRHPVPTRLRVLLAVFSIGLLLFGSVAVITYLQAQQREVAACLQRQANARTSVVAYDDLLTRLSPSTDPALRAFIETARAVSQRAIEIPCEGT